MPRKNDQCHYEFLQKNIIGRFGWEIIVFNEL